MNYLKEVLAFHAWLETNQLDPAEQALWFHLMDINNKCGWTEWFAVANMTLQARLGGIDRKTLDRKRDALIIKGRIEYKNTGKRKAGKYRIIALEGSIAGNIPLETGLSVPNGVPKVSLNPPALIKQNKTKQNKEKDIVPFAEIVGHLNTTCGTRFKPSSISTRKFINARWQEGHRLEDFKAVIDKKAGEWLNDPDMSQYLRPETLFGTKFEGYLNQKGGQPRGAAKKPPADDWEEKFYTSGTASGT